MNTKTLFHRVFLFLIAFATACDNSADLPLKPVFKTKEIETPESNYSYLTAEIDQEQLSNLRSQVSSYGFVWSIHPDNTRENSTVIELTGALNQNSFSSWIADLTSKTRYYVRAFMVVSGDVYYSNEVSFFTRAGSWKHLGNFPGAGFTKGTGFSLNGIGYVVSGNQVWSYHPGKGKWTQKSNFPTTTDGPTSMVLNEIAYVYCGSLYQYDVAADTWSALPMPSDAWLTRGCAGPGAFVIDGKIYIAGGHSGPNYGIVMFDPATKKYSLMPFNHQTPTAGYTATFAVNNIGYVVCGHDNQGFGNSDVLSYDVRESKWSRGVFLGPNGYELEAGKMLSFVIDNKAYVAYGTHREDLYYFNTFTNTAEELSIAMAYEGNVMFRPDRKNGIMFSIGKKGYVGFGTNRDGTVLLNDFWEFNPD